MRRAQMIRHTIYVSKATNQAMVTPDGIGVWFYDTVAQAEEQHGGRLVVLPASVFDALANS